VAAKSAQNLVCARLTRSHKGFVQDPYRRSTSGGHGRRVGNETQPTGPRSAVT